MGVMAMSAEQVLLLTVPVSGPFAVYADFPVAELVSVALSAKTIGLRKGDDFPRNQTQAVAIVEIVTVKTPALPLCVVKDDVVMHVDQLTALRVGLHVRMAVRAGEDVFRERRRRDRIGCPFVCTAFVLFDFLLNDQIAVSVEEFLDLGGRDGDGAKCQEANGQRQRSPSLNFHGYLLPAQIIVSICKTRFCFYHDARALVKYLDRVFDRKSIALSVHHEVL